MQARSEFLLAHLGLKPTFDRRALAREQLADIMPTIAVFAEALNHAHFNHEGDSDFSWADHQAWGPEAVVSFTDKRHPHKGMYDRWFHFLNGVDGTDVSANWHDPKLAIKESIFVIDVNESGSFDVYTQGPDYNTIRRTTVASADAALTEFGDWMDRNFDQNRLSRAQSWVPKIMEGKMSLMPQPRTNWVGPFANPRLTA